jgi:RNA polymerase sigma-70 factor (ECF subfamily)
VFGDTEQSKDIFQETFMRFYESAQKERVMTNVPAFLLIIARNLCLNVKRQTKEMMNVDDYQIPQLETPPEQTEMLQLITMAMELLPDDYRETFFLRDFEDMSYAEISKVLKIPEVTVRVRVSRARQKIREILQPYLVELAQ